MDFGLSFQEGHAKRRGRQRISQSLRVILWYPEGGMPYSLSKTVKKLWETKPHLTAVSYVLS